MVPVFKRLVLDFLDYLKMRVEDDTLTLGELESIVHAIENNMELEGTAEDFARFYGQSQGNVHTLINRRMLEKPKRRVTYRLGAMQKIVPEGWKKKQG